MKKLLLALLLGLAFSPIQAFASTSRDVWIKFSSLPTENLVHYTEGSNNVYIQYLVSYLGFTNQWNIFSGTSNSDPMTNTPDIPSLGVWHHLVLTNNAGDYSLTVDGNTFFPAVTGGENVDLSVASFTCGGDGSQWVCSEQEPLPPVSSLVRSASTTMAATVGFTPSTFGVWMVGKAILITASGFGLLAILLPYVIALAIITLIVTFLYRAFKFFKH